jgi:hypothetical protein
MELLPQSREALDEYLEPSGDGLELQLRRIEGQVVSAVPDCVAMSVTLVEDDLTFTFVESPEHARARVATAYAVSLASAWHALDEDRWAAMAREQAAVGIASSISLPVMDEDRVVLGIDVYAGTPSAFDGRVDALAHTLGAWPGGAVTNADLAFETRRRAEDAPRRMRERREVEVAVGVLAAREGVDVETARDLLSSCARRAGIADVQAAMVLQALPVR